MFWPRPPTGELIPLDEQDRTLWGQGQIAEGSALVAEALSKGSAGLNYAIAAAMVDGPEVGLELLEALDADPRMAGHYRLDAVRGHLFERAGESKRAIEHYRAAAERTASIPERNYLTAKAARLSADRRRESRAQG